MMLLVVVLFGSSWTEKAAALPPPDRESRASSLVSPSASLRSPTRFLGDDESSFESPSPLPPSSVPLPPPLLLARSRPPRGICGHAPWLRASHEGKLFRKAARLKNAINNLPAIENRTVQAGELYALHRQIYALAQRETTIYNMTKRYRFKGRMHELVSKLAIRRLALVTEMNDVHRTDYPRAPELVDLLKERMLLQATLITATFDASAQRWRYDPAENVVLRERLAVRKERMFSYLFLLSSFGLGTGESPLEDTDFQSLFTASSCLFRIGLLR